jgi:predicted Zn-dependent protease
MKSVPLNIALRYLQRRVLLLSLIPLALLFAITVTLARTYHALEAGLVQKWYDEGNADLLAGRSGDAMEDFRHALSRDPDNNLVQPRLAEAPLVGGRITEARSYFLNLWDSAPCPGEVNLESLTRQSDLRNEAMQFVFHVEEINSHGCGSPDPADQALVLFARRRTSSNQ